MGTGLGAKGGCLRVRACFFFFFFSFVDFNKAKRFYVRVCVIVLFPRIEPVGNPTGRSAFKLNGDLGRFINRILGRNVQGHGLDMSWLIVALEESM